MERLFFDHNATTPIDPRVIEVMHKEMKMGPSNPSSIHSFGRAAKGRLAKARETIAAYFGKRPKEFTFTSGGTESLHLAILGLEPKRHIVTSSIVHAAISRLLDHLKTKGLEVTYLPVAPSGHVSPSDVEESLRPDTDMIILSVANGETGIKTPIHEIAALASAHNIPFIVDGVALLGKETFSIPDGVTAMAFSSHKIHGPQGMGLLYHHKKCTLKPLFYGGGQESKRRSGTENLAGIIGLAKAIDLLNDELPSATEKMEYLRDTFEKKLKELIPGIQIIAPAPRLPNTSSITFPNTDGENLLIQLDMQGLAASMGSACSAGSLEPSGVLLAMGLSREEALRTLRFSFSRFTTEEEIDRGSKLIASVYDATKTMKKA
ncbi:MAG: Cysteine desulfurase NifS [Chlamydiae bacterium]|nr:Cysteine desulfurase NifS [Chlamydiota bacterium]